MKVSKHFILWLLLSFVFSFSLHAQKINKNKVIHGVVLDTQTLSPISGVHIATKHQNVVSGMDGKFSVTIFIGDSILFTHVSYLTNHQKLGEKSDMNNLVILLIPNVRMLKEVKVISLFTEEEFREKILESTPQLTLEEEIARENNQMIHQMIKYAMPLPMTSYEQYRDYIKGPQGVTILSSDKSKGLIKAVKNVVKQSRYKVPSSFLNHKYDEKSIFNQFKFIPLKKDTLKIDSVKDNSQH